MATEVAYDVVELHVALNKPPKEALRISGTNNNPLPNLQIVANDKFLCRIRFYEDIESVLGVRKLAGGIVQLNAVAYGPNTGDDVLFQPSSFTLVENGNDAYYEGLVNTETAEVTALMGSSSEKTILFSIQIANALGVLATRRKTVAYQQAALLADGYDDAELATEVPPSVSPVTYFVLDIGGGQGVQVSGLSTGQLQTNIVTIP